MGGEDDNLVVEKYIPHLNKVWQDSNQSYSETACINVYACIYVQRLATSILLIPNNNHRRIYFIITRLKLFTSICLYPIYRVQKIKRRVPMIIIFPISLSGCTPSREPRNRCSSTFLYHRRRISLFC